MEITPMVKTSYQINGLSKGCLGITYYFVSTKTVATGGKKPVAEYCPLKGITHVQKPYFEIKGVKNFCLYT